ncbi:glycosyltransferase family 4 protein, partial [Microbacterium sp. ISL-103]|uniref:glycosyltransferase family 4 protein n=1 Tax=Microbacterium sp. ISL-103 TaxID=2819156 RepID=UPI001BE948A2
TMMFSGAKSAKRVISWLHFELGVLRAHKALKERPDIVIGSSLSLLTVFSGLALRRRYKAKFIFEVRDIWPLTIIEEGGFSPRNPLVRLLSWVERLGYRKADAIVGTMPNLREHVAEVLNEDRAVECIPMGYVEGDVGTEELPAAYRESAIPSGKTLIGYAGTVGTTNALDAFFACAAALSDDPTLHFVLVGDGDLREAYQRSYGSLDNLTFVGRVPRSSVQRVLQEFDILYFSTFPSRVWDFGQSLNKLIDYMLAGKPIVGSYSGYPSMVNEADSGVFVPADDPQALVEEIRQIAGASPEHRREVGERGARWIRENRNYRKLAADYESIMLRS